MADIDIYGDLCADLPSASPVPASSPAPPADEGALQPVQAGVALRSQASAVSPPIMVPPSSPPPPQGADSPKRLGLGAGSTASTFDSGVVTSLDGAQTWVAPGWAREGFVVEGGEVLTSSTSGGHSGGTALAPGERPHDFEALRQELVAQEERRHVARGSPVSDGPIIEDASDDDTDASGDEGDGGAIQLGEVRASQVGARPVRRYPDQTGDAVIVAATPGGASCSGAGPATSAVALVSAPVPANQHNGAIVPLAPDPASQVGSSECFILLGGLPPALANTELRKMAEHFAPVRAMRVLEEAGRAGRSAGIALIEYQSQEGARKAAAAGDGFCSLSAWLIMCVPPPRLVLVGRELLGMMRCGIPPWPDGGPCSEDLRCVLNRQFDMWRRREDSPPRSLQRRGSSGSLAGSVGGGGRGGSPEPVRREEGWADKLRALKRKVNSKQDLTADVKRERT
mmetsp:Transcript_117045/g.303514  ORF Transcript_117045/g.303514 Transcript_117045/m.303514 type:complete len:455 (-) Transcript_117045:38-1402(-)